MADRKWRRRLRRVFSLYALYAKMDFAWLLQDTATAGMAILSDTISQAAGVAGVFLVAWRFDGIGDMGRYEVLFMLAYAAVLQGLFTLFFDGNNTGHFSRRIGRGQLDHMMIQPVPIGLQLLTEGFLPVSGNSGLVAGLVILAVAVRHLGLAVTPAWVLAFAGQLSASLVVLVGLMYLGSTTAFYAPVAAEEITSTVYDTATTVIGFPLSNMPRPLQAGLLTVLPSGLLAWFPALVLLGRPPLHLTALFPYVFAVGLSGLTAVLMKKGWNHYARQGSPRYSAGGFR